MVDALSHGGYIIHITQYICLAVLWKVSWRHHHMEFPKKKIRLAYDYVINQAYVYIRVYMYIIL